MSDNPTDDKSLSEAAGPGRPDDELHLEASEASFNEDVSLDGPEPEPGAVPAKPEDPSLDGPDLTAHEADPSAPPKSQALKDLEDHQQEGGAEPGPAPKSEKRKAKKPKVPPAPGAPRGYQWFFVHVLGVLGLVAWAVGAFAERLPYRWEAGLIALAVIVLTIPTMRSLHVRTRAGLAGLGAALGMVLCSFYDPDPMFLPGIPMAIVWAFILVVGWFWVVAAVWRNPEMRKNSVCLALTAILLYPLAAPAVAVAKAFFLEGQGVAGFTMSFLSESPQSLTESLPWFLWPQTILSFLIPFLAVVFLLRDQVVCFRTAERGHKHLGDTWLALATIIALVFSFLTLAPATEDFPQTAAWIRNLWPTAAEYRLASAKATPAPPKRAAPAKPPAVAAPAEQAAQEPVAQEQAAQEPAPQEPAAPEAAAQESPPADLAASEAEAPPAEAEAAASEAEEPPAAAEAAASEAEEPPAAAEAAASETEEPPAAAEAAASETEEPPAAAEAPPASPPEAAPEAQGGPETAQAAQDAEPPLIASPAASEALRSEVVAEAEALTGPGALASLSEPAPLLAIPPQAVWPEPAAAPMTVTVTSLEVGSLDGQAAKGPATIVIGHEPAEPQTDPESLADRIAALTEENSALKNRLAVVEAQNELLKERLKYNDELILTLTGK